LRISLTSGFRYRLQGDRSLSLCDTHGRFIWGQGRQSAYPRDAESSSKRDETWSMSTSTSTKVTCVLVREARCRLSRSCRNYDDVIDTVWRDPSFVWGIVVECRRGSRFFLAWPLAVITSWRIDLELRFARALRAHLVWNIGGSYSNARRRSIASHGIASPSWLSG